MCFTYQKFHACNAKVGHDSDTNVTCFVSYDTRICEIKDNLIVVGPYFRYSPATRKQFSRFLCENNMPHYLTIKALEHDMLKESGMYTGEIFQVDGYDVTFSNDDRFQLDANNANDAYDFFVSCGVIPGVAAIVSKIDPC